MSWLCEGKSVFLERHTKDLQIKECDVYRSFSNGSKRVCVCV